jgi:regulatory protein spx
MIQVFTLSSNKSSRSAVAWLRRNEIAFVEQKMNFKPPTLQQLKEILSHTERGTDQILAKTSKAYKQLIQQGVDFEEMTLFELAYVIRKHPTIMKGPILLGYDKMQIGFNKDDMNLFMPRAKRMAWYAKQLETVRAREDQKLKNGEKIAGGHW